jgi:hypothetical protein
MMKVGKIIRYMAILVAMAALGAACGKKGPPKIPIKLKETVYARFAATPYRGGALLTWEESEDLPSPAQGEWAMYRIIRKEGDGEYLEAASLTIQEKGGGVRYQYADLDLVPDSEYSYLIQLLTNDQRVGSVSPELKVRPADGPAAPTGLSADPGDGQVILSWKRPAGEEDSGAHNIFRRDLEGKFNFLAPINRGPVTETTFTDSGVENGKEYCYTVNGTDRREDISLEGPGSPEICARPSDSTPPAAPADLTFTRGTGFVILNWSESSEADVAGYRIYRHLGKDGRFSLLTHGLLSSPYYKDESIKPGSVYYYAVTSVDSSVAANESPFSKVLKISIP